jgi:hypothetical protein
MEATTDPESFLCQLTSVILLHSAVAFSNQPRTVAADQVYCALIPFHSLANGMSDGIEGDPRKHAGKEKLISGGKSGRECSTRFLSVA